MPQWDRRGSCPPEQCRCCHHIVIFYKDPGEKTLAWLYAQQVRQGTGDVVKELPGNLYAVDIPQTCTFLLANDRCGLHPDEKPDKDFPPRPEVCDEFPAEPAGLIFDETCGYTFVLLDDEGNEIDPATVDPATIQPYKR